METIILISEVFLDLVLELIRYSRSLQNIGSGKLKQKQKKQRRMQYRHSGRQGGRVDGEQGC